MLLRNAFPDGTQWDDELLDCYKDSWLIWSRNLESLDGYQVRRMYTPTSFSAASKHKIYIYSDASEGAVAAAAYIEMSNNSG